MSGIRTVAITRPLEDAQKLASELQAKGYVPYLVPMLDIRPIRESVPELEEAILQHTPQLICATSRHAVRMLAQQDAGRSVPLVAVGTATANEAKALGFGMATDAGGNAQALTEHVIRNYDPARGSLLYTRGADVNMDIATVLRSKGFAVTEVVTYKAEFTESLPQDYVQALKAGEVDAVMFFSRRSAQNYVRLVREEALQRTHGKCVAIGEAYLTEILAELNVLRIQQTL